MASLAKSDLFRRLPSVDELVRTGQLHELVAQQGHALVADAARVVLARMRAEIASGRLNEQGIDLALAHLDAAVTRELHQRLSYSLRPLINATGVVLHTNLGRAPLSQSALDHIRDTAQGYSNLEFDLARGERSRRDVHVAGLFQALLSPQEVPSSPIEIDSSPMATPRASSLATLVVNNNAAAVLLALNSLAEGGEVIVSRGELVEIGGSFRIPEVMAKSNAVLREVGTTNRTRTADYQQAVNERTKLLLRVHRSNFEIRGFTEQPALEELVALSRTTQLPLMHDLGSGALLDLGVWGMGSEPSVLDSLRAGVDVVTYSGDKLLGGPQAGILSGKREQIARMRTNPLFRALRVDKLIYAALEATLLAYVKRDYQQIPALRMMQLTQQDMETRAQSLANRIRVSQLAVEVTDGESLIGGGAAPSAVLPTRLLALSSPRWTAQQLADRLLQSNPPVVARVEQGRLLLDLRTVFREQDEVLLGLLNGLGSD